jgi:hypothetical protein
VLKPSLRKAKIELLPELGGEDPAQDVTRRESQE